MHILLIFLCIPILLLCPILYPPLATFTAIFFFRINKWNLSLGLIFSAAVVSALISATIVPFSDTEVYLNSFIQIRSFDFSQLKLDNNGFEPLYKVYEYILSIFLGDNTKFFLLATALIFNLLSTLAILRICLRFNQHELACVIFATYYSLVPPALGVSLFLLRSGLSFSIALLAISFYKEKNFLAYLLGTIAVFIHSFSITFLVIMIFQDGLTLLGNKIQKQASKNLASLIKVLSLRFSLIALLLSCALLIATPDLLSANSQIFLSFASDTGESSSGKADALLGTKVENFVDFTNPVFLIQGVLSSLCFLKIEDSVVSQSTSKKVDEKKLVGLLELLRLIGRWQIMIIVITGPFGLLPYRLGLFNFLYFPLWLINIPYLSMIQIPWEKYSKYLTIFALASVLAYTFYWMPKKQTTETDLIVLEGRSLSYNMAQVVNHFFN